MSVPSSDIEIIRLLLARLERISVDSHEAHRASGVRGALLKELERMETGQGGNEAHLRFLEERGFAILNKAARRK